MWKVSYLSVFMVFTVSSILAVEMTFKTDLPLVNNVPIESSLRMFEGSKAVYDVFIDDQAEKPDANHEILVKKKLEQEDGVFWQVYVTYTVDGSSVSMRFLTPVEKPTFDLRKSPNIFVESPMIKTEVKDVQIDDRPEFEFVRDETLEVNGKTFETKLYQQAKGEDVDRFWFAEGAGPYRLVKADIHRAGERRLYMLSALK